MYYLFIFNLSLVSHLLASYFERNNRVQIKQEAVVYSRTCQMNVMDQRFKFSQFTHTHTQHSSGPKIDELSWLPPKCLTGGIDVCVCALCVCVCGALWCLIPSPYTVMSEECCRTSRLSSLLSFLLSSIHLPRARLPVFDGISVAGQRKTGPGARDETSNATLMRTRRGGINSVKEIVCLPFSLPVCVCVCVFCTLHVWL